MCNLSIRRCVRLLLPPSSSPPTTPTTDVLKHGRFYPPSLLMLSLSPAICAALLRSFLSRFPGPVSDIVMGLRKVPLPAQGIDPKGVNLSNGDYYNQMYEQRDKNAKPSKVYEDTTNHAIDRMERFWKMYVVPLQLRCGCSMDRLGTVETSE